MKIKIIHQKNIWQNFFNNNCDSSFLHSWEWGELQKSLGYPIIRLGFYNNKNQLEAICLVVKIKSKRGNFLFVPHGPIINNHLTTNIKHLKNIISNILKFLIDIAKKENYSFIRMAPILEDKEEYQKIFADLGFKIAPIYMHAETTWELPLLSSSVMMNSFQHLKEIPKQVRDDNNLTLNNKRFKTDDELLSAMRKTTRYLIRKAIRDGVIIKKTTDPNALKIFYQLYQKTAKREKFTPFSFNFIKNEFEAFSKANNVMIFLVKIPKTITNVEAEVIPPADNAIKVNNQTNKIKLNNLLSSNQNYSKNLQISIDGRETKTGTVIASSLIFFTKLAAFYHQGASLHTKIPATYLLQWEAIKEAKNRGCQLYNFWGIYDEQRPQRTPKSWQGLTLFKTGFSGQIKRFLSTQDYVVSKKYYFNYILEKFLMWKRSI